MIKLDLLEKKLNLTFRDENLIRQAFIHRSYLNESKIYKNSNERLEFLGDSILSFLVSSYLYSNFPDLTEGELTNLRSSMVKTATLARISQNLDLGNFLFLSRGEEDSNGRKNTSILADTFEALLGAIFLDQGIESARKVIDNLLIPLLSEILSDKTYIDTKSAFQEAVQEEIKVSPIYKVLQEKGPDHAKEFTVGVYVANILWGIGTGKSKQEGETKAAQAALEKWTKK